MRISDLPVDVVDDLCRRDSRLLDIDPGFDAKHEFWMDWYMFLEDNETDPQGVHRAEFIHFDGYDVLLPVPRSHHSAISLIRLVPAADRQSLTLFLQDTFLTDWFREPNDARCGFLAVADRYQRSGADFYLASYYHFSYLLAGDFEKARRILSEKLGHGVDG